MATAEQLDATEPKPQVVSTLLSFGLYSYQWGKSLTLAQYPSVASPLEKVEDTITSTITSSLASYKLTPDAVVAKLDSKAAEYVEHYEVDKKYSAAKTFGAKQILKLKGEDAMTAELAEEIELQQLIADAREVAWDRVSGLQTKASDKVDSLIEDGAAYVETMLPAEEGEVATPDDGTKKAKITALSSKVSRRFKKKAMAKFEGLTLKLRESTSESPIVHLDLVRYSELLDIAAVRQRVANVGEQVQASETYAVVKGYVVDAATKTEALKEQLKVKSTDLRGVVEVRVLTPAAEYYAILASEFIKRSQSAKDLVELGSDKLQTRKEFAAKYLAGVKAQLGAAWTEKLYQPTMDFLKVLETEFEPFKKAYNEGVENPNVTTADGKPYTIDAGLNAFVAALRLRLGAEWEARVVPSLEKLKKMGRKDDEFMDAKEQ